MEVLQNRWHVSEHGGCRVADGYRALFSALRSLFCSDSILTRAFVLVLEMTLSDRSTFLSLGTSAYPSAPV